MTEQLNKTTMNSRKSDCPGDPRFDEEIIRLEAQVEAASFGKIGF